MKKSKKKQISLKKLLKFLLKTFKNQLKTTIKMNLKP